LRASATALSVLNWEGRVWIESWQDTKWINLRATPRDEGEDGIQWTGLMTNISQGRKLQEEIRESRRQLAELSAHVEQVKEQERERIERDLHDDLGGNLSALKMMLEHVWKQVPQTPYLAERRDYLNQLLDRSIESIHRISADLRPGILDAGLVAALEWLAQEQQEQTGLPYRFSCNQPDIELDPKVAISLFRVAQEACNNIRKHAQATCVDMRLYEDGEQLLMEIIDNGIGMEGTRRDSPRSFGLRGMAERMTMLGGEFSIASLPNKGTIVTARLPLDIGRTATGP
jgi:signal transduction histidine kinase